MTRENVRQVAASNAKELADFVRLERRLVGSNDLFVSETDSDLSKRLKGESLFLSEAELGLFIGSSGEQDVSRCVAVVNRRYQAGKDEPVGFVGYFAAASKSAATVHAMLGEAEAWLRQRGVSRVITPYNGAAFLGIGLLTDAFDEEPVFPMPWHPPYYADYFTGSGFSPSYPLWFYTVDFGSEKYRALQERASANVGVVVRPVNKKNWNEDIETFGRVLNEAFEEEWEFHPFSAEEFHEFFDPLKPVLDPRQTLIAEVGGKPAGFCLGLGDLSPLFRSFKGRMGPLQIVKLMLRANRYKRAGLIGIGVLQEFRGTGVAQALAAALYRRYEEQGLQEAFYYPVNEVNARSRGFAESIGGSGRLRYHCYDKRLTDT